MCDMPASETERLIDFDTGTLYEAAGEGAFAPGLQALSGDGRVAGPALTVACPPGDNLAVHVAVAQARQGEILVVQTHDWGYGVWGEVLTVAAMARDTHGSRVRRYRSSGRSAPPVRGCAASRRTGMCVCSGT